MADKTINQLTQATDLTDSSLFVIEQNSTAKQANWGMMKNYISPGVAAQYSTSATYNVGDYVIYNGSLYRCNTAIATGEAWTAAHWTAAVLCDDFGEFKSHVDYTIGSFTETTENINTSEMGRYYVSDTGIIKPASNNYICMKKRIPVEPSSGYTWNIFDHGATASIAYHVAWYDVNGAFINRQTLTRTYTSPSVAQASPGNAYFMCMDAYSTHGISSGAKIVIFHNSTIRPSEYISPYSAIDLTARSYKEETDEEFLDIKRYLNYISETTENINTSGQGRYYVSSGGAINQSSENYIGMLNKISCAPNTDYTAKVFGYTGNQSLTMYFAFYDTNGTFISRSTLTKDINNLYWQITTPDNCGYLYFDAYASNGVNADAKIFICIGGISDLPEEYISPYTAVDIIARDKTVPSYFTENLLSAISRYRTNACAVGADGESFIFFTDVHIKSNQMHTPELIKYLIDNTNLSTTICGGDILDNYDTAQEAIDAGFDYIKKFSNMTGRVKTVIGNHDTNKNSNGSNPERWLTPNQLYAVYCSQSEKDIENVHCIEPVDGYADVYYSSYVPSTNTLYLFVGIPYGSVFDNEIDWILSMLTDNPDKNVILFSHYLINPDTKEFSGGTSNLISRIKGFQNLKGYVFGHVHYDHVMYMDTGIPMISVDTDSSNLHNFNPYTYTVGTITEQAFDIITADYENKSLYCARIGRGKNRNVNGGINSVNVSSTITLSTSVSSPSWASDNMGIATVNNGVVTGVSTGSTIIKAYNDADEEYWYVVVN